MFNNKYRTEKEQMLLCGKLFKQQVHMMAMAVTNALQPQSQARRHSAMAGGRLELKISFIKDFQIHLIFMRKLVHFEKVPPPSQKGRANSAA